VQDRGPLHRLGERPGAAGDLRRPPVGSRAGRHRRDRPDGAVPDLLDDRAERLQQSGIGGNAIALEVAEREPERRHVADALGRLDPLLGVDRVATEGQIADGEPRRRQRPGDADRTDRIERPALEQRFDRRGGRVGSTDARDHDVDPVELADRVRLGLHRDDRKQAVPAHGVSDAASCPSAISRCSPEARSLTVARSFATPASSTTAERARHRFASLSSLPRFRVAR